MQEYKNTKKKIYIISFVLVFMLSVGLYFAFSSYDRKANADFPVQCIHNYVKETSDNGYVTEPVKFSGASASDSAGSYVSATYHIHVNDVLIEQLSSNYNHFIVCYGRKDVIEYLYARTAKTDTRLSLMNSHNLGLDYRDTEFCIFPAFLSDWFEDGGFNWALKNLELKNLTAKTSQFYCEEFFASDIIDPRAGGFGVGYGYNPFSVPYIPLTINFGYSELCDIGIYIVYQYNTVFSLDNRIIQCYTHDLRSEIISRIEHASDYGLETARGYEKALGIYRTLGSQVVVVQWQKRKQGSFNKYEEYISPNSDVPIEYIPDKDYIWSMMLTKYGGDLSYFNVNYTSTANYVMSNGVLNEAEIFGSKVLRQALGYEYSYSVTGSGGAINTIPNTVYINITYSDYYAKDFYIKIANDNSTYVNNFVADVFPTSWENKNGRVYLYFDYNNILELFGSTFGWSAFTDDLNLVIDSAEAGSTASYEVETLSDGNKRLVVSVSENRQQDLMCLEITGIAPITIPVELTCHITYKELYDDLTTGLKTFSVSGIWSDKIGMFVNELLSPVGGYADKIYDSIKPSILNGSLFIRPYKVAYVLDAEAYNTGYLRMQIYYEYNQDLLIVMNNVTSDLWVYELPPVMVSFTLEFLGVRDDLPAGYRIGSFSSNKFSVLEKCPENPLNTVLIRRNTSSEEPCLVYLILTDKWPIRINYLEQYKDTCFAELKEFSGEIKVSDYEDIFGLTGEQVSEIIGQNVDVLIFNKAAVRITDVSVVYDVSNDKYAVDLKYTRLSLKTHDADGNQSEMLIGLTPFSEWSDYFGEDWSILYLAPDRFQFEDEIPKDKLYGFFSVAVFKEQIKDFDSWFNTTTYDGCFTVFSQNKVQGSGVYTFLRDSGALFTAAGATVGLIFGHPIIGAGIGTFVKYGLESLAEVINDDNGEYYSYFFYLDGTTNKAHLSFNGADDYYDDSPASINFLEDVVDEIKGVFDGIGSTPFMIGLKIILGLVVLVICVGLVVKVYHLIFSKKRKR